MLPGPALIQADLDYHMAGVNKKIQQHIIASQGRDVKLDMAFIMAIEMVCLFCVCSIYTKLYFLLQGWQICVDKRIAFGTSILMHDAIVSVQVGLCSWAICDVCDVQATGIYHTKVLKTNLCSKSHCACH